jgi:hypothetical protein
VFLVPPILISFAPTQIGILETAAGEERRHDYECCAPVFVASPCLTFSYCTGWSYLLLKYMSERAEKLPGCVVLLLSCRPCESLVFLVLFLYLVGLGGLLDCFGVAGLWAMNTLHND